MSPWCADGHIPSSNRRLWRALIFQLLPDPPVDFLVERRTTSGKLPRWMLFGSHQSRAIRKRAAGSLAVKPPRFYQTASEIGMGQCRAAETGQRHVTLLEIGRCRLRSELLQ